MLREQHFARLNVAVGEGARRWRQEDVAFAHVGEAQRLQHFGDGKQLIHLQMQREGDLGMSARPK